jgi:hypothetical protein
MSEETSGPGDVSYPVSRASEGERLYVFMNRVKADKCELHEHFVHEILYPAALKVAPTTVRQVRFLHPTEANDDGTYAYFFLMDPVIEGADYNIESLLKQVYGEEKAQEYNQIWFDTLAEPQVAYEVIQSPW